MLKYGKILESENRRNYLVVAQQCAHPMGEYMAIRIYKDGKPYSNMNPPKDVQKLAKEFHDKYKKRDA